MRESIAVTNMMDGIRILEVAEHTFVPLAAGILADWGADVIKIEHPERGDAMRGLAASGGINVGKRRGPRPDGARKPWKAKPGSRPHER